MIPFTVEFEVREDEQRSSTCSGILVYKSFPWLQTGRLGVSALKEHRLLQ